MSKIITALRSSRPSFLILTPVCVFLGLSAALSIQPAVNYFNLALVLLGAIAAHISVNTLNEYFDFRNGLDFNTSRTPFSGGSGGLVANPEAVNAVFYVAVFALLLTVLIGIYFITIYGLAILPIGIAGILIVLTYTQWINKNPLLCLVAPGLGFGPLMVVGTSFVLTGEYTYFSVIVSLVPFFLVNNLLLLNQYPDIEADRNVGRNHFPIAYGVRKSTIVYASFVMASIFVITIGIVTTLFPKTSLISFVPLTAALVMAPGILKNANDNRKLIPYLGINVVVAVTTPVILAITLLIK